jgi:hypothetical protein
MGKLYLRWQTRRYPELFPGLVHRIGNGETFDYDRHRMNFFGIKLVVHKLDSKGRVATGCGRQRDNDIVLRKSWTKARM